jgi:hypothetical protein
MASDAPHKQEFRIRDLSTRSVLLFPTRAQIIRDIKDITLHPGANQIIIDGLAPTVDEHSIKVEGTGSATITEVSVDLLPNREIFEDIYPSDGEEDEESAEEVEEEDPEAMTVINKKIKNLNLKIVHDQEKVNSAAQRLKICEYFGNSVAANRPAPSDLDKLLEAYREEREKIHKDNEIATAAIAKFREEIEELEKEKLKLVKAMVKAKEKVKKEKAKLKEKKLQKEAEIYKEKQRIRAERESFWPKKVYRVTISLEPSTFTPAASRRSSIDGDTIVNLPTTDDGPSAPTKASEVSLSLSYITYSASWAPRYDLSLNTVNCTGVLEYGAELRNLTSETWRDAKVILSTSQTTFSGLSETIPLLTPWHVRLFKGGRNPDSALFSSLEIQAKQKEFSQNTVDQSQKKRGDLFGRDNSARDDFAASKQKKLEMAKAVTQKEVSQTLDRSHAKTRALTSWNDIPGAAIGAATYHQQRRREVTRGGGGREEEEEVVQHSEQAGEQGFGLFDNEPQSLTFEEGAWEESGMTTSYDCPGLKTIAPNNSTIKHKIAKIDFKNVIFSHIVVGKLRQVAFLKARLRNASKITLLKGPLGLTLDGSFLGQSTFPRCSSGESFSLPLGVDPAITIAYPKPTVQRSQSGIFSKEDSNVFTRSVLIVNTKHNAAAEITVLDQIPVSEDERLKIEIINPKGLKVGGEWVRTGSSAFQGVNTGLAKDARASVYGEGSGKWGSAVAMAKKGGEVAWNVKLNPGQGVKLVLEYEATFPGGETVVGV